METVITETFMLTKASIVQRLLDEKQITAEEAVVLLNNTQVTPYAPINPMQPEYPRWQHPHIYPTPYVYCTSTAGNKNNTLNVK